MAPFSLQEEVQALQDLDTYHIAHEHEIDPNDQDNIAGLLAGAVEAVATSSEAISEPEVFDVYRSLLKHSAALQGSTMNQLLDSLSSGLHAQVELAIHDVEQEEQDVYMAHKQPLEMYVFLVHWFVSAAEKVSAKNDDDAPAPAAKATRGRGKAASSRAASKKSNAWSWSPQIPATLTLLARVLRIKSHRIWTTTAERDAFINCVTRPAYHVTESKEYMKNNDIKLGVYKVICLAVKNHGHGFGAQISIMQCLQYFEHLAEPMAEALTVLVKEFDHPQLAEEILREVAGKTFSANDSKSPRVFSRFLVHLTQLVPRLVLKQASLLLGHLDSESYPMRMAVVEMIGELIKDIALNDEEDEKGKREKKIRGLYELLGERFLDLSAFVRVKVMNTLIKLCDMQQKFPQQRLKITEHVIATLDDKMSSVRRAAIALLTKLITTHPYGLMHGGELNLTKWEERYAAVCKELDALEQTGELEKPPVVREDAMDEDEEEGTPKADAKREPPLDGSDTEPEDEGDKSMANEGGETPSKPNALRRRKSDMLDLSALNNEQAALATLESHHITHLTLRKRYYAEGLSFIRQVESAMETVGQLLGSKAKAEVLEAMDFFRTAHEYEMDGAESGIKQMLHLVWAKDNAAVTDEDGKELKGVKARLIECYRTLYFDPVADMEPKQQVNRITKNMIELTYTSTLAQLTSLEELLRTMMEDDQIHGDVIAKLWAVYSSNKALPKEQRRGAILILGMLAVAKRHIVQDRIDTLLKVGLGPLGKTDLVLARYTCIALQRLSGSAKKVKGSLVDKSVRLPMDSAVFRKLSETIVNGARQKEWFGMAEQAINTIYALGERPDELCDTIIRDFTRRVFGNAPAADSNATPTQTPAPDASQDVSMADETASEATVDQSVDSSMATANASGASTSGVAAGLSTDKLDAFLLSQLLFIVGHVAIKHIVFLELVEREWKRQKEGTGLKDKLVGESSPARSNSGSKGEELDQVAGNAEDEIGDRVAGIRESELLYGPHSLLAKFGPMLVHICGSPRKYKNPILRSTATLAFAKFLCVSSQFCDAHHRLLFKILETSRDAVIRSNIVIGLGDLAVCFSNVIDENNAELYRGLSDANERVKKNTLMVLTHLILNGMIKIKGQLGEMAKCLEDKDERIAALAKLFFTELSTKDNAIYNNLPDVISHLSVGDHAVDEETFQSTMKYIFTFIEKEKQAENIVEKLCQRMRLAEEPRQWRDIAFCLSLLPFKSDRSVKKLIEGLPFYQDKLHEPTVFELFTEILTKARQRPTKGGPSKPEAELNEFEAILQEAKRQGEEDQELEKRVETKKAAAKKRSSRRTTQKR